MNVPLIAAMMPAMPKKATDGHACAPSGAVSVIKPATGYSGRSRPSNVLAMAVLPGPAASTSFDAMKAQHEAKAPPNHFRKGGVGGWREYFSSAQVAAMDAKCNEVLGTSSKGLEFDYGI